MDTQLQPVSVTWSAIITVAATAQLLIYHNVEAALLPVITLGFLLFCPGMAFVQLMQIDDGLHETVLAVVLSIVLDMIVAAVVLYAGLWSPELILTILIYLSLIGVIGQLWRWVRASAGPTAGGNT